MARLHLSAGAMRAVAACIALLVSTVQAQEPATTPAKPTVDNAGQPAAANADKGLSSVTLEGLCQKSPLDPDTVVDTIPAVPRTVSRREILPRFQRLPGGRPIDLLMVTDAATGPANTDYRVYTLDPFAPRGTPNVFSANGGNQLVAVQADKSNDFSDEDGTDLRPKVMLTYTLPRLPTNAAAFIHYNNWFRRVDVYVIGCGTATGTPINSIGYIRTTVTNQAFCRILASLLLLIAYVMAALCVSSIRESKIGSLWSTERSIRIGAWGHLDPVTLSASDNGKGSATKLQMLFFTMIVLWLVFYIWLMTEHLSDLSNTVLLLMGIAGVGATAAAGADVAKNRLSLDNWAWLVTAKWLPQGGIAAITAPRWRDIFTTNGEFDVPRFQLITFSFVVGCALLASGADLADLSKFSIPQQLLSILGLSQVVYVAGKLVAPPTMADLDAQLTKLREAQTNLAMAAADVARANTATALADQKAMEDAKAAFKAAEDVARIAFVSVYQISPGQFY